MKDTGFSRVSKNLIIEEVQKELKTRPTFFVVEHGTTSANAMDKLRAKLRSSDSRYIAVKQSLGKIALEKSGAKELTSNLTGACGFVFTSGDPSQSSKMLVDFAKENLAFKINAAFMNGAALSSDRIKVLASLPTREVLLSKVLGGMQTPISKFVNVLSGTVRKVVTVIDAIAKKKGNA